MESTVTASNLADGLELTKAGIKAFEDICQNEQQVDKEYEQIVEKERPFSRQT